MRAATSSRVMICWMKRLSHGVFLSLRSLFTSRKRNTALMALRAFLQLLCRRARTTREVRTPSVSLLSLASVAALAGMIRLSRRLSGMPRRPGMRTSLASASVKMNSRCDSMNSSRLLRMEKLTSTSASLRVMRRLRTRIRNSLRHVKSEY